MSKKSINIDGKSWLTVKEVAWYLATTERHIRSMVFRKEIPHSKLGRLLRFNREVIDEFMFKHSVAPPVAGGGVK